MFTHSWLKIEFLFYHFIVFINWIYCKIKLHIENLNTPYWLKVIGSQPAITFSKLAIEALELGVEYVQS